MKFVKGLAIASLSVACAASFASCGKKGEDYSVDLADKTSYKVGVLQYVTHDALDLATEGFKEAILEGMPEGKTVTFVEKNPQADNAAINAMASTLVRDCDLVMGNATPAATALKSAAYTESKKHLPILFTSTTDPVDAKLVKSLKKPGGMVTGTSDINPVNQQIDLAVDLMGTSCKIGFLYTASETNSAAQCNAAKSYIKETYKNVKVEEMTIPDASSISAVTTSLAGKVDVIYIPTDNLLAANMAGVTNVTNEKKVPVICGESSMVANGGTFTLSISYKELGRQTGEMALDIMLNNQSPSTMAVKSQTDVDKFVFDVNTDAVTKMNLTLSADFRTKYKMN